MSNGSESRRFEWTPELISALFRALGGILLGGILLGMFAASFNAYYVIAAAAAVLLALVIAWQFEAAIAVYLLVAFVPWGGTPSLAVGGSGVGKQVYVSQLMLGFLLAIWFIRRLFSALPSTRIRSGFHVPLALYLAYSVLNVVNSFVFWDYHVNKAYQYPQVNAIELGLRVLSAGAFIMMATTISTPKWLKWTTVAIMIPGLYNLLNAASGSVIPVVGPWWPLIALMPVAYCLAYGLETANPGGKRALAILVVALGAFIILVRGMGWISGWLGLLVTISTVLLVRNRKVFAVYAVVLLLAAAVARPYLYTNVVVESEESGDYARFSLLAGAWRYATTFPLGVGVGNYRTYNSFYYGEKWGTTQFTSAHGTYAQHLSEMGIPGTALFLSILIGGGMWTLRRYREMPPGLSKTYLLAAFGQLVGVSVAAFIGDYIIPTYHNGGIGTFSGTVYSWLIWGLAVSHVRLAKPRTDSEVAATE